MKAGIVICFTIFYFSCAVFLVAIGKFHFEKPISFIMGFSGIFYICLVLAVKTTELFYWLGFIITKYIFNISQKEK